MSKSIIVAAAIALAVVTLAPTSASADSGRQAIRVRAAIGLKALHRAPRYVQVAAFNHPTAGRTALMCRTQGQRTRPMCYGAPSIGGERLRVRVLNVRRSNRINTDELWNLDVGGVRVTVAIQQDVT